MYKKDAGTKKTDCGVRAAVRGAAQGAFREGRAGVEDSDDGPGVHGGTAGAGFAADCRL